MPITCNAEYSQKGPKCQRRISFDLSVVYIYSLTVCHADPFVMPFNDSSRTEFANRLVKGTYESVQAHFTSSYHLRSNHICTPVLLFISPKGAQENIILQSNNVSVFYNQLTKDLSTAYNYTIYTRNFDFYYSKRSTSFSFFSYDESENYKHMFSQQTLLTLAPWQNCPLVVLPNEYSLNYSDFTICILEYNICFDSLYAKIEEDEVAICLDLYTEIINNYTRLTSDEGSPETYFSIVCLAVSSLGCLLTVTFSLTQPTINLPTKINIALTSSLFLANTFYTTSRFFIYFYPICMIFAILSHFLWLCVLCWLSISCIDVFITMSSAFKMTYNRTQLGKFFKYLTASLVLSTTIVAIHIQVSFQLSEGYSLGYSTTTCFMEDNALKIFTLLLPVALMVSVNLVLFIAMTCCIQKNMQDSKSQSYKMLKIFVKLSTITGVTWVFGLLYELVNVPLLSHTHTLLSGSLGILIFMAFGSRNVGKRSGSQSKNTKTKQTASTNLRSR